MQDLVEPPRWLSRLPLCAIPLSCPYGGSVMPVSSNSKIVAPDAAHKTKSMMQSIVRIKGSSNFDGQSFGCSDRLIAHHIPLGESSGTTERLIPLGTLMVNERSYMSTQRWIRGGVLWVFGTNVRYKRFDRKWRNPARYLCRLPCAPYNGWLLRGKQQVHPVGARPQDKELSFGPTFPA